jgi:LemA protein
MSWVPIVVLAVVVLLALYLVVLYNGLVQKRNRVDNAWSQIEVQLKRRRDLIPNLLELLNGSVRSDGTVRCRLGCDRTA